VTKLALVFPGQGSQSLRMMAPFATLPEVRATFAEAGEVLGEDLWRLAEEGPAEDLNRTVNTQPVMLAAGVALLRAWRALGGAEPDFVAGHSLGEYTALVAAGALDFAEAVALVRFRAQAMQDAVPEGTGAIAAVLGLDDEGVRRLCAEAAQGEVLEAANYNAPGQVVIAGERGAVERAIVAAKAGGAKRALLLPMSVPSHCSLMRGAAERLGARIAEVSIRPLRLPLVNNADVTVIQDAAAVRDSLVRQLFCPVRWVETVRALAARGATRIVECGPGGVLSGLNRRCAEVEALAFKDAEQLAQLASAYEHPRARMVG
jgi:[acyl-carrier-protein] S-malonyltransferase